jgi:DNA repair exonuclease SbcCD nuclease subunit
MKILYYTDPHNSDTPPRMRKRGYRDEILLKQIQLIETAKKCDIVICGGDVFHQKNPANISYALVNEISEIYREYGKMIIVPGNHDVGSAVSASLWTRKPLNLIANLPNVEIKHKTHEALRSFHLDKTWSIACYGLADAWEPLEEVETWLRSLRKVEGCTRRIAVIHAAIAKKKYMFPTIQMTQTITSCADIFLLGHMHDYQHIHGKIVAPGALSRGVFKMDDKYDRDVQAVVVEINDDDGQNVHYHLIKLTVKDADEVFKVEDKEKELNEKKAVGDFLQFIDDFKVPKKLSSERVTELILKSSADDNTKELALDILKEIG